MRPTRWTVQSGSVDAILKNYTILSEELEQMVDDSW